ncbi:MAG: hypothetical protein M1834_001290 [Cirrosporium novae-zelandiae]|nr:MAG: hypothetical protein M1834_001290 [Cirrosporium novae-zelandiae]
MDTNNFLDSKVIINLLPNDDATKREDTSRTLILTSKNLSIKIGRSSKTHHKNLVAAPDNTWFDCPVMSRDQAQFQYKPQERQLYLKDNGSMHGTWVKNERILAGVNRVLFNGDVIRFGQAITRGPATINAREFRVTYTVDLFFPTYDRPNISTPFRQPNVFTVPDDDDDDDDDDMEIVSEVLCQPSVPTPDKSRVYTNGGDKERRISTSNSDRTSHVSIESESRSPSPARGDQEYQGQTGFSELEKNSDQNSFPCAIPASIMATQIPDSQAKAAKEHPSRSELQDHGILRVPSSSPIVLSDSDDERPDEISNKPSQGVGESNIEKPHAGHEPPFGYHTEDSSENEGDYEPKIDHSIVDPADSEPDPNLYSDDETRSARYSEGENSDADAASYDEGSEADQSREVSEALSDADASSFGYYDPEDTFEAFEFDEANPSESNRLPSPMITVSEYKPQTISTSSLPTIKHHLVGVNAQTNKIRDPKSNVARVENVQPEPSASNVVSQVVSRAGENHSTTISLQESLPTTYNPIVSLTTTAMTPKGTTACDYSLPTIPHREASPSDAAMAKGPKASLDHHIITHDTSTGHISFLPYDIPGPIVNQSVPPNPSKSYEPSSYAIDFMLPGIHSQIPNPDKGPKYSEGPFSLYDLHYEAHQTRDDPKSLTNVGEAKRKRVEQISMHNTIHAVPTTVYLNDYQNSTPRTNPANDTTPPTMWESHVKKCPYQPDITSSVDTTIPTQVGKSKQNADNVQKPASRVSIDDILEKQEKPMGEPVAKPIPRQLKRKANEISEGGETSMLQSSTPPMADDASPEETICSNEPTTTSPENVGPHAQYGDVARPAKRMRIAKDVAKYAANAFTWAVIGSIGTIAGLNLIPPGYFE